MCNIYNNDELNSTDPKLLNYTVSLLRCADGGAQKSQSHFAVNFICKPSSALFDSTYA